MTLPATSLSSSSLPSAVSSNDHGLDQVVRTDAQTRVPLEPGSRLTNELLDSTVECLKMSIKLSIGWQPQVAPIRNRRKQSAEERGEDLVEVNLDDLGICAEGIDVLSEGEPRRHVDSEAHQVR